MNVQINILRILLLVFTLVFNKYSSGQISPLNIAIDSVIKKSEISNGSPIYYKSYTSELLGAINPIDTTLYCLYVIENDKDLFQAIKKHKRIFLLTFKEELTSDTSLILHISINYLEKKKYKKKNRVARRLDTYKVYYNYQYSKWLMTEFRAPRQIIKSEP